MEVDLDTLAGQPLAYYGAINEFFKLSDTAYHLIEDESDGYRSYLDRVDVVTDPIILKDLTFQTNPIAIVEVVGLNTSMEGRSGLFEGHELVDVFINHRWALLGTSNTDDYYPYCTAEFYPLAPANTYRSSKDNEVFLAHDTYRRKVEGFPASIPRRGKKIKAQKPDAGYIDNPIFGSW